MPNVGEVYKCDLCGNIACILHAGKAPLFCCGQQMTHLAENTVDAAKEKHVPVIEKLDDGKVKVSVGSVAHPMEEKHYIEWIELYAGGQIHIKMLQPGEKPEAVFAVIGEVEGAREYCNLHGLWKG